jgi:hypothetical protein
MLKSPLGYQTNQSTMIKGKLLIMSLLSGGLIFLACEKEGENEIKNSAFNGTESHNMGQNCMNCHKSGGRGEGWFTAAGTVYGDSPQTAVYPNATVKLFTGRNGTGTLKYYTTNNLDFSGGLYPAVSGRDATRFMNSAISNGQCNSCHGNSTDRIRAN